MSDNIVNCIVKDANGFIWISQKDNTISRFDGYSFTHYPPNENEGWYGFQCWRGGLTSVANGNFRIYSRDDITEYDISSDRFYNFLEKVANENPGIQPSETYSLLQKEIIWLIEGTRIRKLEPDGHSAWAYRETILNLENDIGKVTAMQEGPGGVLWIGTKDGIYSITHGLDQIRLNRHKIEIKDVQAPSQNIWRIIFTDEQMWFISNNGIVKSHLPPADASTENLVLYGESIPMDQPEIDFIPAYYPLNIVSDGSKYIYFRTSMGIYRYSILDEDIVSLFSEPIGEEDWPRGHYQFSLLYDDRGLLWAGSRKGLLKINLRRKQFHDINTFPEENNGLTGFNPSQVLVDKNKRLWVGTTSNGLYMSQPDDDGTYKDFIHFPPDKRDSSNLFNPVITFLYEDARDNLYVASGTSIGRLQQIIMETDRVRFRNIQGPGAILRMTGLPDGKIFITSNRDPGWIYDPENDKALPIYLHEKSKDPHVLTLQSTSDQYCYLASYSNNGSRGLYELPDGPLFSSEGDPHYHAGEKRLLLDNSDIGYTLLFEVTENLDYKEFWIFADGALYRYRWAGDHSADEKPTLVRIYNEQDGLKTNTIYEMFADLRQRIWLTTPNGLYCLNPQTDELLRYFEEDGLKTSDFYWGKHMDDAGNIFLCSNKGVIYFHPDSILPDKAPPVFISDLKVFNESLIPGDNSPLKQAVMLTDRIVLPYNQNSISINFVALDYTNTREIEYRYRLEGLDKKWVQSNGEPKASYAYLRPGSYTFRVSASNSNGIWNENGDTLQIRIKPPPWFSWWGISIYTILLLFIILWYRSFLIKRARMTNELENERLEKQRVLEIDEMKSRFFANISHEFRTPLSLILGPVEDALKSKTGDPLLERDSLKLIHKNTKRLRQLINQLLDLSKLETGAIRLMVSEGDLSEFVRNLAVSFLSAAESRKIVYSFDLQDFSEPVYFDADKVEKILTNLISNALKFSSECGIIHVQLEYIRSKERTGNTMVEISVLDSGVGIPKEEQEKIFDRFYQAPSSEMNGFDGTGIGLSLTKELVELYRGSITLISEPGQGSTFKVTIPVSRGLFRDDEVLPGSTKNEVPEPGLQKDPEGYVSLNYKEIDDGLNQKRINQPVILVVEDHEELGNYIKKQLDVDFHIIQAGNGKEGFIKATETIPDLIVSDLMMPEMDGLELCEMIKNDDRTSHVPFILLTAKADQTSKLDGLQKGADAYMLKPFDSSELRIRVKNLIDQRNMMREKFSKGYFSDLKLNKVSSADDRFLQKTTEIIVEHIADDQFTVEMLSQSLAMSNSQLYRKLQALTGLTPSHFIRNLRLKQSLILLEKHYDNISSIAYEVGFTDHSYFSKCFKELFGVSPSQYKSPGKNNPAQ